MSFIKGLHPNQFTKEEEAQKGLTAAETHNFQSSYILAASHWHPPPCCKIKLYRFQVFYCTDVQILKSSARGFLNSQSTNICREMQSSMQAVGSFPLP